MTSTICGQSMTTSRSPVDEDVECRQVAVRPTVLGGRLHDPANLLPEVREQVGLRAALGQPGGGHARVLVPDELHEHLGVRELDGVGDREAELPESAECAELRARPLPGDDLLAEVGPAGHGPHLPAPADPAALEVAGVAVEEPPLSGSEALGGHRHADGSTGDPPADQVDVGLLARLEDPELGLDRSEVGDHPVGAWSRTVGRTVPGRPALALGRELRRGVGGVLVRVKLLKSVVLQWSCS